MTYAFEKDIFRYGKNKTITSVCWNVHAGWVHSHILVFVFGGIHMMLKLRVPWLQNHPV